VHAPDHGRLRPWRFVVIDTAARAAFGDVLAAHLQRTHASLTEETLQRERQKAYRAPMIIVVAAHTTSGVKIPVIEQLLSAAAAAQAILLAAAALGFNGMWKTGAPAYDETVKWRWRLRRLTSSWVSSISARSCDRRSARCRAT
jgi:nitroreductase